jgi:putative ABC transport system permease protein
MFKESIKMSWQNIIHNKMRSFLTVLGILIGVASIIALISIVQGVTDNITSQVMDMGANKVTVQALGTPLKRGLTINDLESISSIENIKGVSPSINGKTNIVYDRNVLENVSVQGKNEVHFANTQDLLKSGRVINSIDVKNKNRVCLIGSNIVSELFPTENPIDKKIAVNGLNYIVIGTLQSSSGFSVSGNDDTVVVPYTTAMSLLGTGYINSLDVYMRDESLSDTTTTEIESALNTAFNYNEDGYSVSNMQNILDTVADMTGTMTLMLAGIACISLVVGGIGIMNMMLVTVTERTSEIGLRKALGAEPKTIQWQFVLEALFLSLFGGLLGLLAGVAVAFFASLLIGTEFIIAGYSVVLAFGFSAIIGLGFGFAPARKASRLNPIEALRSA